MMMCCPRCQSPNCVSARFESVPLENLAAGVTAARVANKKAMAIGSMLVWAAVEVVNLFLPEWKCHDCRYRF